MTELQLGLIGLGTAAVVGVVAYNKWQEYRHRKLAEQVLNVQHSDVLFDGARTAPDDAAERDAEDDYAQPDLPAAPMYPPVPEAAPREAAFAPPASDERIEPVLHFEAAATETAPLRREPAGERISAARLLSESVDPGAPAPAPRFSETAFPAVDVPPARPPVAVAPEAEVLVSRPVAESRELKEIPEPLHLLSPVVDYVAAFEAVEPAPAYQILESQQAVLARLRKPVYWIGFNEQAHEWEVMVDDGRSEYRRFRAGLQLVDRQGAVGEADLTVFHIAMQDLADELMAIADLPPRLPALEAAVKLDEFCASVDIQIGINVISQGQAFAGTKLRALAEAAGMVIDADGRFVRCDDEGNVLYLLLNQEAAGFSIETMKSMTTNGLTFLLDVPRVSHGERVFNQMVEHARRFADVLRGSLVDDNRRPLSEGALEPIRRQVGQYQTMLAARQLPAGGPLTRRLFS